MTQQMFGGDWTEDKLERVKKYLSAYTTLMKGNSRGRYFRIAYIDAFAGTGYRSLKHDHNPNQLLMPELAEDEPQSFLEGSATIALRVQPRFDQYIFIEKNRRRFAELERLATQFPDLEKSIRLIRSDANSYIVELCRKDWTRHRAVLFLDPYGMQVAWSTVEAIARTQAMDLWYLFPIGAVSRLLRRDARIDEPLRKRLDEVFGEADWFDAFYLTGEGESLFGTEIRTSKEAKFADIQNYVVKRLKSVFSHVADNPRIFYNSKGTALFLLCFAAGNKRGGENAIKIAEYILGS